MSITNIDVIYFYSNKKEHYPISDDFIKKYQQKTTGKGSYISYALNTGHLVCDALSEPNQKWHLLESYYLNNIKKKGIGYLQDAPTCGQLLCPELILWMAEAADINQKVLTMASLTAKKEIDRIRKEAPEQAFSAKAVRAMNKNIEETCSGRSLWSFIKEKIITQKK